MRTLSILALFIFVGSAHADECDAMTSRVIAASPGTAFKARLDRSVQLAHPDAIRLYFMCPPDPDVRASSVHPNPPPSYFQMVGHAGSVIAGVSAEKVRRAAIACHQAALRETPSTGGSRFADIIQDGVYVNCVTSQKEGTYIIVNSPDSAALFDKYGCLSKSNCPALDRPSR